MSFRTTISYIFWPLTIWYAIGVAVRNLFYSLGLLKQEAPHITTIGVGNLCTGGTGKTPHVEYMVRLLSDSFSTAVLSRGYKRRTKGFCADDGSHDVAVLGDEPAMMAAKYPQLQVAVCEKRVEGVRRLMAQERMEGEGDESRPVSAAPEIIILDDVFQHRSIKPNINILLTEYRHPYYNDHILPYGDLREFRNGRNRAGIVVVTKCPAVLNPIDRHNIMHDLRLQNYQKMFFSYLKYGPIVGLDGRETVFDLRKMDCVLALTGIAHPEPMIEELRRSCKVQHMAFPDHHRYTKSDIVRLRETFDALKGDRKIILTTEKDAIRLRGIVDGLPVYVLPIEVAFHKEQDQDFDQVILSMVRENVSFLNKLSIWS